MASFILNFAITWLLVGLLWLEQADKPPPHAFHYRFWAIATVIGWSVSMGIEIYDWVKHE